MVIVKFGAVVVGYLAGVVLLLAARQPAEAAVAVAALAPTIALGGVLARRRPHSPVGPALAGLVAAPALTSGLEAWGASFSTGHPLPAAHLGAFVSGGVWTVNLAGFVALCLVFPDGRLPGRRWRLLPWAYAAVVVLVVLVIGLDPAAYAPHGGPLPDAPPLPWPDVVFRALDGVVALFLLAVLGSAVAALIVRYRRGDERTRLQLRWLMLGAATVPVLLAAGWIVELAGAPVEVAYVGFMAGLLLLLPAAVAIAVLRYDLLDVDRLLGTTVAWLVTSIAAAAVFAAAVLSIARLFTDADERVGTTAAAFATALLLLPLHRRIHAACGRILDRERTVMIAAVQSFVRDVRDGVAQPEQIQDVLRAALPDPALTVLLRLPGRAAYVDLTGAPAAAPADRTMPLEARGFEVGALVLSHPTARRRRQARELTVEARLPIEVSRLRLELRHALGAAQASRARLVEAVTEERRRLERDLHDGAQQRILAVGMRLRSAQRTLPAESQAHTDLDLAVAALEATIAELRRIAHGIRPSRLDEGLEAALTDLVRDSPVPAELRVAPDADTADEASATTAYYVVAESLANALKHAAPRRITVTVGRDPAARLMVDVTDDGRGGATEGFGLSALRDRVTALGGRLTVTSPPGLGTTVHAEV
jgi:signal transduction histidine kinase